MLHILALIVLPAMAGLIAYLAFKVCLSYKRTGISIFSDIGWLLEKTPALYAFGLFAFACLALGSADLGSALMQVSNHIILSLDIIYFLSLLMLILYHTFKPADHKAFYQAAH